MHKTYVQETEYLRNVYKRGTNIEWKSEKFNTENYSTSKIESIVNYTY